jgi:superfamily II DNA or RNA helicase
MDSGNISKLAIKSTFVNYPDDVCKYVSRLDYQKEIDFLISCERRNDFIVNLAMNRPQNTLVLFNYIDRHGKILYEKAKSMEKETGKKVFWIVGEVDVDKRAEICTLMETSNNSVLFANYGTMSVGVNVKNIHYLIMAHPFKAQIRVLQSIGRTLRKLAGKHKAILIDVIDDLRYNKHENRTYDHGVKRLVIYEKEQFDVESMKIELDCTLQ